MNKRIALSVLVLLTALLAGAQEFGGISGRVTDAEGNPLPGVAVTLTGPGTGTLVSVTGNEGRFRFFRLPSHPGYALEFELPGFKNLIQDRIAVSFGREVRLEIVLQTAPPEETVSGPGRTPMIDKNSLRSGSAVSRETLLRLPVAGDPWAILAHVPGLVIDRADVGGNESGQQSYAYGQGAALPDTVWTIDGAEWTDPGALGDAPAYVHLDNYEEMRVDWAGADARIRTGGIEIQLVSRRGGNALSGALHFDLSSKSFELNNVSPALTAAGYDHPGLNAAYLYGLNLAGPVVRDKVWASAAFGVQDIDKRTMTGRSARSRILSGYFNLDARPSPTLRLNGFLEIDEKRAWNRTPWSDTEQSAETLWNQSGPTVFAKGEIEKQWGSVWLVGRVAYAKSGFLLEPVTGPRTADGSGAYQVQSYADAFYVTGSADEYRRKGDRLDLSVDGRIFVDRILGGGHELAFGASFRTAALSTSDAYEGNLILFDYGANWIEASLLRDAVGHYGYGRVSAYVQDTIDWGRLSLTLGLRYDREESWIRNLSVPSSPWMSDYLPQLIVGEYDPGVVWSAFSPRLGLSYDLSGDGRNILRLSLAVYGSPTGFGPAEFINPAGAGIGLLWVDADKDQRVTAGELWGYDWQTGQLKDPANPAYWLYSWGFDPAQPDRYSPANRFGAEAAVPLLDEILLSYEREVFQDFAARFELLYRKRHRLPVDRGILADGTVETSSNWYRYAYDPVVERNYWTRLETPSGTERTSSTARFEQYVGAGIILIKRFSRGWMLSGSFTWADWKMAYGGDVLDPTNLAYFDGGPVASESQGEGLQGVYVHSRWTAKLSGLFRLPLGLDFSAVLLAREGYIIPTYAIVYRPTIGASFLYGQERGGGEFGDTRLPAFFQLNARLEKIFSFKDKFRISLAAEGFNILNASTALKRAGRIGASDFLQDKTIVNPGLFRFGIGLQF